MKKVEAIVRDDKLRDVLGALENKGFVALTATIVNGRGQQKGLLLEWRVGEYRVDLLEKIKVEVVVRDEEVPAVIDIICESARTGEIGDGMIFVTPIEHIQRIRTGETDLAALRKTSESGK
jgi:nitrogen regulatory protein P-II 1